MKKATLTLTLLIEETPKNLESLKELQEAVDNGEIAEGFADDTEGVTAIAKLSVEDI